MHGYNNSEYAGYFNYTDVLADDDSLIAHECVTNNANMVSR